LSGLIVEIRKSVEAKLIALCGTIEKTELIVARGESGSV
jgi:hypothetical protein